MLASSLDSLSLLVDDEECLRRDLAELLLLSGYEVPQAGQHVDLLVTDVGLPNGVNGRQLADTLQTQLPNLPVLFITCYADVAVLQREGLPPDIQILRKPFAFSAFSDKIDAMLKDALGSRRSA